MSLFAALPLAAARRALVIGNAKYTDPDLDLGDTPRNDADEIASRLGKLGFLVTEKNDVKLGDMPKIFDDFAASIVAGDAALFYYSGHAIQVNGQNYLWPSDTSLPPVTDIAKYFVPISRLYTKLKGTPVGTTIVILDACRNNPYYSKLAGGPNWVPGLALPSGLPDPWFVAYATDADHLAENTEDNSQAKLKHSPFTRALLATMSATGAPIETVFYNVKAMVKTMTEERQTPATYSSLGGTFYFHPPVVLLAAIHGADDDALLVLDGAEVLSWNNSPNVERKIQLHGGDNELLAKVFNQKSFTGGLEIAGGHKPEGWNYHMSIHRADGTPLIAPDLTDVEDVPVKDGPHQGHLFTVARVVVHVDDETGAVTVPVIDRKVWTRD